MECQVYFIYCSVMCVCVCVCVFFVSFTMKCCQKSGLLSISMLKVIQIFAVLYFHVFDKMTKRRIKKKKKQIWSCSCRGKKKEEWIFKNTIMLVNLIHKLVCFIGFIAAMTIVKWNLGNDKSPNSSLISSNEKKERKKQYLIIIIQMF